MEGIEFAHATALDVWDPIRLGREIGEVLTGGMVAGYTGEIEVFEEQFADYVGDRYCVMVGSGTSALQVAMHFVEKHWLQFRSGQARDRIIIPNICPVAVRNAVLNSRLQVGYGSDAGHLYVHMYGYEPIPIGWEPPLVEDCSHGVCNRLKWAAVRGWVRVYSFYPTKPFGCLGNGGAITLNDGEVARQMRSHVWAGTLGSHKPDPIQARVLRRTLQWHMELLESRSQEVEGVYLHSLPRWVVPVGQPRRETRYVMAVLIMDWATRQPLSGPEVQVWRDELQEAGIPTMCHYPSLRTGLPPAGLVSLPFHRQLTTEEVRRVCQELMGIGNRRFGNREGLEEDGDSTTGPVDICAGTQDR